MVIWGEELNLDLLVLEQLSSLSLLKLFWKFKNFIKTSKRKNFSNSTTWFVNASTGVLAKAVCMAELWKIQDAQKLLIRHVTARGENHDH